MKIYYVYKEFDNEFGYKERVNVTTIFENLEELFKFMNKRKEFYTPFWETRKIEIEILGDKENE